MATCRRAPRRRCAAAARVGSYAARLDPAQAAQLRTKLAESGYATAEEPRKLGPDVPTVTIGEGLYGEEPELERTFERARLDPRVAEAFEALVEHVERALRVAARGVACNGNAGGAPGRAAWRAEVRARVREDIGREPAKWPHPLVALAQGRARLALQVRELGTERLQQVALERGRLALVQADGLVADAASCTSAPGSVVKLTGNAPAFLEPGNWSVVVLVSLAEPADSDETTVYGTWTIDLGTCEVKP